MGLRVARGEGVGRIGSGWVGGVEELVEGNHVAAHVVGPLEDLRSDVGKERVGRPSAKDHDAGDGVVL